MFGRIRRASVCVPLAASYLTTAISKRLLVSDTRMHIRPAHPQMKAAERAAQVLAHDALRTFVVSKHVAISHFGDNRLVRKLFAYR